MTRREPPTSAGVLEPAAPPPPPHSESRHPAASMGNGSKRIPGWEEIFHRATAEQRLDWLSQAADTGVLYTHRLNASDDGQPLLGRLQLDDFLAGRPRHLDPIFVDADAVHCGAPLDERQRQAVALILQTPDLGLIQGSPGSGKSTVVAEAIAQAMQRGWRVLLVAPDALALDCALDRLGERPDVFAWRVLGKNEREESLAPRARAITLGQRVRSFEHEVVLRSQAELERLDRHLKELTGQESAWGRLEEILRSHGKAQSQREDLVRQQADVSATAEERIRGIRANPEAAGGELSMRVAAVEAALRDARMRPECTIEQAQEAKALRNRDLEQADALLESVRKVHDAKRNGRWWSPNWWSATFRGDIAARLTEQEKKVADLRAEIAAFDEQIGGARKEQQRASERAETALRQLTAEEVGRSRLEIEARIGMLDVEMKRHEAAWLQLGAELDARYGLRSAVCPKALGDGRGRWLDELARTKREIADLREWLSALQDSISSLPQRILGYVNLALATSDALGTEDLLPSRAADAAAFDLVVVEDAHLLDEGELALAARQGKRWVLVGEPQLQGETADGASALLPSARGRPASAPRPRSGPGTIGAFQRLWQALHCSPRMLPGEWVQENDRICCRLRPVDARDRQWLQTEPVADSSEVELRIFSPPRTLPQLAEVAFPRSMSIADAKTFILRELQELPLKGQGRVLHWLEHEDRLVVQLADTPLEQGTTAVLLEPGVRELVYLTGAPGTNGSPSKAHEPSSASGAWHTCCLEFDRGAGWHRARVRQWLKQVAGLEDLGRTVLLKHCHRTTPELGRIIAEWIGSVPPPAPLGEPAPSDRPAVTFVAVPPLPRQRPERGRRPERSRNHESASAASWFSALPRSGAGLELDLADPRQHDRLPVELREGLPRTGIVNYLEAQSVIRALPEVLERTEAPRCAVIALYAAQAQLLRNMLRHNPALAAQTTQLRVDVPQALRHREFDVVLVSMTRSHSHKAVPFGDLPEGLTCALTRGRRELLLFADPGTILRRVQGGPADRPDERAGASDCGILSNILRHLQGQASCSGGFRIRQCNST